MCTSQSLSPHCGKEHKLQRSWLVTLFGVTRKLTSCTMIGWFWLKTSTQLRVKAKYLLIVNLVDANDNDKDAIEEIKNKVRKRDLNLPVC